MENERLDIIIEDLKEYNFTIANSPEDKITYSKLGKDLSIEEKNLILADYIHYTNKKFNRNNNEKDYNLILASEWELKMKNKGFVNIDTLKHE